MLSHDKINKSRNACETIMLGFTLVVAVCSLYTYSIFLKACKRKSVLMEENSLQLDELNKRVARKKVEFLKKRRAALYVPSRTEG